MWPFGKRELHVHISAALLRAQPGDTVLVSLPADWEPRSIVDFQKFVQAHKLLPDGVRLCAVPSSHAPLLISAKPEPKTDEDGDDGHQ